MIGTRTVIHLWAAFLISTTVAFALEQTTSLRPTVAVVSVEGPVFIRPDATRTPLKVLPVGTVVTVGQIQGDWYQVTFNDGQLGRRTGWMQQKFVTLRPSIAEPPAGTPQAQGQKPPPNQPIRKPAVRRVQQPARPSLRGFGTLAFDKASASETFNAIAGTDGLTSFGGGVQVASLWRGFFVEVSAERNKTDGERVFVFNGDVFRLGIPLELTQIPVDIVGGWRTAPYGRVTPYVGGGVTLVSYKETSEFANPSDNIDDRYTGFVLLGGVELRAARWVQVRGEARYRQVDDVLGVGGASKEFGETKLGGFGVGLKVVVGR